MTAPGCRPRRDPDRRVLSAFTGARGADNPLVFAGFVLTNSETGHGSFAIAPRLIAQVCSNGYTITRDAMREVHLGGQLGEGVITASRRWSGFCAVDVWVGPLQRDCGYLRSVRVVRAVGQGVVEQAVHLPQAGATSSEPNRCQPRLDLAATGSRPRRW